MRCALLILLCGAAWALPEQTFLLAIGNNRGDADEVALLYAERDATQFAEAMRKVGGVSPERVVSLLGEDAGAVRVGLARLEKRLEALEGETAVLVFYSGHADANALHLGGTHLPMKELTEAVKDLSSPLRVLIVDACRSGSASRVKGLKKAEDFEIAVEDRVSAEGMAIITSSTAGEDSQESDGLRASFFSHHLVNGLRGAADRSGDDRVTLAEAYAYTYAQVLRSSGRTMNLQHPTYRFDMKGQGEVVLSRLDKADKRSGRLRLAEPAVYVIVEERAGGTLAAEVSPARPQAVIALPPRRYFVQERHPREYRHYEISLRPGEETRLVEQPFERVRYDRLVRSRGGPAESVHGLLALGGARGGVLEGEGITPQLGLGYSADFPWFTVGGRLRFGSVESEGGDAASPRRHDELAVGLVLERFVDLPWFSAAFGVLIEGAWHSQTFTGERDIEARSTLGAGFGALLALERHLPAGLALRLEGGPFSAVFEASEVKEGVRGDEVIETPLTWWLAGGLKWRL